MYQKIIKYRDIMGREQRSSRAYQEALLGLCELLVSQDRHMEALIELEMYLDTGMVKGLPLLEALNMYTELTGDMPMPEAYLAMISNVENELGFAIGPVNDAKDRVREMYRRFLKSRQAYQKMQQSLSSLSPAHKMDALLDYLGHESIPYYKAMAHRQIAQLQAEDEGPN